MADKTREENAIRGVVERLKSAFSDTHSPDEVEAAVAKAHAAFSERPVREFAIADTNRGELGRSSLNVSGPAIQAEGRSAQEAQLA
ncbi:three-helix bundle dimerization domain-containing protein [Streptomyces canus]|uniref:three-helix bundle dimerization domain-containing protein n=1 Tax=Streptomyces canus TaxID=58343 RepID=UPI002E35C47D|nr:hypothetical protein [Streptomyces canus]